MKIAATQLNKKPGYFLDKSKKEPIVIYKNSRPMSVLLSYEDFLVLEKTFKVSSSLNNSWPVDMFDFPADADFPSVEQLREGLLDPKEVHFS